ncbi:MAG: CDP-alcohol phosphatidyltransferase family protein [Verrucomicrobiota bacterium]
MARRYNLVTDLGKLLDPLADKVLVIGTLLALVERHVAPMWMVAVIMAREFLISGLRQIAASKRKILAAERWASTRPSGRSSPSWPRSAG